MHRTISKLPANFQHLSALWFSPHCNEIKQYIYFTAQKRIIIHNCYNIINHEDARTQNLLWDAHRSRPLLAEIPTAVSGTPAGLWLLNCAGWKAVTFCRSTFFFSFSFFPTRSCFCVCRQCDQRNIHTLKKYQNNVSQQNTPCTLEYKPVFSG